MAFLSVFDIIGPNMIGPSSSHTAGANKIAFLAEKIFGKKICKVEFTLYGSFAKTYKGHGSDYALVGGILGYGTDDIRIRNSFEYADKENISYSFIENHNRNDLHPNTVEIRMYDSNNFSMCIRGESLGGGKVRITKIDNVKVDFTGEYCAIIVIQKDKIGVVAHITNCLSKININIALMTLFREKKGDIAYTIVEIDGDIPYGIANAIKEDKNVMDVMVVRL